MKRLDLDALRSKQKKNRTNNERENEQQIRQAQGEFDRQIHLTRLMLESLHPTQVFKKTISKRDVRLLIFFVLESSTQLFIRFDRIRTSISSEIITNFRRSS